MSLFTRSVGIPSQNSVDDILQNQISDSPVTTPIDITSDDGSIFEEEQMAENGVVKSSAGQRGTGLEIQVDPTEFVTSNFGTVDDESGFATVRKIHSASNNVGITLAEYRHLLHGQIEACQDTVDKFVSALQDCKFAVSSCTRQSEHLRHMTQTLPGFTAKVSNARQSIKSSSSDANRYISLGHGHAKFLQKLVHAMDSNMAAIFDTLEHSAKIPGDFTINSGKQLDTPLTVTEQCSSKHDLPSPPVLADELEAQQSSGRQIGSESCSSAPDAERNVPTFEMIMQSVQRASGVHSTDTKHIADAAYAMHAADQTVVNQVMMKMILDIKVGKQKLLDSKRELQQVQSTNRRLNVALSSNSKLVAASKPSYFRPADKSTNIAPDSAIDDLFEAVAFSNTPQHNTSLDGHNERSPSELDAPSEVCQNGHGHHWQGSSTTQPRDASCNNVSKAAPGTSSIQNGKKSSVHVTRLDMSKQQTNLPVFDVSRREINISRQFNGSLDPRMEDRFAEALISARYSNGLSEKHDSSLSGATSAIADAGLGSIEGLIQASTSIKSELSNNNKGSRPKRKVRPARPLSPGAMFASFGTPRLASSKLDTVKDSATPSSKLNANGTGTLSTSSSLFSPTPPPRKPSTSFTSNFEHLPAPYKTDGLGKSSMVGKISPGAGLVRSLVSSQISQFKAVGRATKFQASDGL